MQEAFATLCGLENLSFHLLLQSVNKHCLPGVSGLSKESVEKDLESKGVWLCEGPPVGQNRSQLGQMKKQACFCLGSAGKWVDS